MGDSGMKSVETKLAWRSDVVNLRVQEKAKAAGTRAPTVVLSGETVSAGDIGMRYL